MLDKISINPLRMLEHHSEHYFKIKLFGQTYKTCARCTGQYFIGMPLALLFMYLYIHSYVFDFYTIFILSWILALATIIDWSTVEIFHIRKGNNVTRFITGAMLGISMGMYFWILPASWLFKIITLSIYGLIFTMIVFCTFCRKNNINPIYELRNFHNKIWDYLMHPKKIWATCCCCPISYCVPCCPSIGCPQILCCASCCCIPMICLPFCGVCGKGCDSKKIFGKEKKKN